MSRLADAQEKLANAQKEANDIATDERLSRLSARIMEREQELLFIERDRYRDSGTPDANAIYFTRRWQISNELRHIRWEIAGRPVSGPVEVTIDTREVDVRTDLRRWDLLQRIGSEEIFVFLGYEATTEDPTCNVVRIKTGETMRVRALKLKFVQHEDGTTGREEDETSAVEQTP